MKLLDTLAVPPASESKHIKLYVGDLTAIPPEEAVDLLVVSAFPDDYTPTSRSLIGALHRKGLSVEQLARDKEVDLRSAFSCWLSRDLGDRHSSVGFRRILCFEPLIRGRPAEVVGDVFWSIVPFLHDGTPPSSIAMPLLASGHQRADPAEMLAATLDAAVRWMKPGLPLDTVKIVVLPGADTDRLSGVFSDARSWLSAPESQPPSSSAHESVDRHPPVESGRPRTRGEGTDDLEGLTDLQLQVLRVLWQMGEATAAEVRDALRTERSLAPTTVATLLARLEQRGLVAHHVEGRQHVFRALVDEPRVRSAAVDGLLRRHFHGDRAALMRYLSERDG